MRMKSTHVLGTLELVGDVVDLNVKGQWLIMNLRTTTPAGWNLKTALSYGDLFKVFILFCKPKNLLFFIFSLFRFGKKRQIPEY